MAGHQFIGYIHAETGRAYLFQDHYHHEPIWMPKSQSTLYHNIDTFEVTLIATNWICDKKGIAEFTEMISG